LGGWGSAKERRKITHWNEEFAKGVWFVKKKTKNSAGPKGSRGTELALEGEARKQKKKTGGEIEKKKKLLLTGKINGTRASKGGKGRTKSSQTQGKRVLMK